MAGNGALYTPDQRFEIQEGKKKGLNTTVYEDPGFLAIQMREIRLALEKVLMLVRSETQNSTGSRWEKYAWDWRARLI